MSPNTKKLLEAVETWPAEDQEELAEAAREIEARRKGAYEAIPEELVGVDRGLEDARQGDLPPMKSWPRCARNFAADEDRLHRKCCGRPAARLSIHQP